MESTLPPQETNVGKRYFLRSVPWIVLLLLVAFVALNLWAEPPNWAATARSWTLSALLIATALWFIACFTGDAELKEHHGFVFAYAFTFGAFALLVTPFFVTSGSKELQAQQPPATQEQAQEKKAEEQAKKEAKEPVRPPEGVLQLVRGCVRADAAGAASAVSAVTQCPSRGWVDDPAPTPPAKPASAIVREVGRRYAWLVSIGGVTVREFKPILTNGGSSGSDSQENFVEVHGGLAVPLFVVVLAFIGGAVSLSRRLPEYQRRSEAAYVPTEKEPAMLPFQARESIIFQIMQLVSAPFLAMATWYIVSPATLASAAVLAFGTGFASEPLLLMIRGMIEGIRPEGSRMQSPKSVEVRGSVLGKTDKQPKAKVNVMLKAEGSIDSRSTSTNDKGEFLFANVAPGKVKLTATAPEGTVEKELTVGDKSPPPIDLVL